MIGYTVPHLLWMAGVPLGIDDALLSGALGDGLDWVWWLLCAFPVVAGLLTIGLTQCWGQQLPSWVPLLGARRVPRHAALIPAALAAVALIAYGSLGIGIVAIGLADGRLTPNEVAAEWAIVGTETVFLAWGLLLAVAVFGYYRTTSRQPEPMHTP